MSPWSTPQSSCPHDRVQNISPSTASVPASQYQPTNKYEVLAPVHHQYQSKCTTRTIPHQQEITNTEGILRFS
eukprot:1481585-Rhodomonas_salina.1